MEIILDYDDFGVLRDGTQYFCFNKIDESFIEVEIVAELRYNVKNDTNYDLDTLFDSVVCGEQVTDNEIIYYWFNKVN